MVQDSEEHINFYCTSTFLIFQGTWQNVGTWQVLTVLPIAASAAASRCECDCHRFAAKSEIVLNPQNKSCSSKSPSLSDSFKFRAPRRPLPIVRQVAWLRPQPIGSLAGLSIGPGCVRLPLRRYADCLFFPVEPSLNRPVAAL